MDWQALGHLATTFESTHIAPADAADAFYIVVSGDDLLIKDDDGDITPISTDDWRWCGLEAISEHCLGVVNQVPIYAVEVADDVDEPEALALSRYGGFYQRWIATFSICSAGPNKLSTGSAPIAFVVSAAAKRD